MLAREIVANNHLAMLQVISNSNVTTENGFGWNALNDQIDKNIAVTSIRRSESGGTNPYWSPAPAWHGTFVHEFGHSFGKLVDEIKGGSRDEQRANSTRVADANVKWQHWFGHRNVATTPMRFSDNWAVPASSIYSPSGTLLGGDCLMVASWANRNFCGVCRAELTRRIALISGETFHGRSPSTTASLPNTPTVTIPQGAVRILDSAFHGNTSLQTITIPASVTIIGDYAFLGATGLRTMINNARTPQRINITTFAAGSAASGSPNQLNRALITVNIPAGTTAAYRAAGWTDFNLADPAASKFNSGMGTANDPYIITTTTHLINVREFSNDNKYFKLGSNINLQNVQWTPIESLSGNFDGNSGNGYTISNLKMTYTSNNSLGYGLFQNNYGSIQNLKVTANINFQNYNGSHVDTAKPVGVIAVRNYGEISNCQVSASGSDPMINCKTYYTDRVGGITAYNNGNIYSCKNNGVIYSGGDTGGIAGYNMGIILECENNALICYTFSDNRISTTHSIGGIAGINYYRVSNVINKAMILYGGYSQVNDKFLQPRMAHIVGTNDNSVSSASWTSGASVNKGNLISFSWTENGTTYTHNQALYVRNATVAVQY